MKLTNRILGLTFFFFLSFELFAQKMEWQHSYGGYHRDEALAIDTAHNEGYIVAGYSNSYDGDVIGNNGNRDCWIIKLNKDGSIDWQKNYGGSRGEKALDIHTLKKGGYIVAGYAYSDDGDLSENKGESDYWVFKLDNLGNIIWQKTYGGTGEDEAHSVKSTPEGGYIVAGNSNSPDGDIEDPKGSGDCWVIKLDSVGNIEWQRNYGSCEDEFCSEIQLSLKDGYMLGGRIDHFVSEYDYWFLKLGDYNGYPRWQRSFGGSEYDHFSSFMPINSGYILAGSSNSSDQDISQNIGSSDYWILKLNKNGNIHWENNYGGDLSDSPSSIDSAFANGYIIAGTSSSENKDVANNYGRTDIWILKLDKEGNMVWQKNYGGSKHDYASSIIYVPRDGYVVAGASHSSDGDLTENNGKSDLWILKISEEDILEEK